MQDPSWRHALVDRLVADARPVGRLWRPEVRLVVWYGIVLVALGLTASRVLRPDLAMRLRAPGFLLEELSMAIGAGLLGLAAMRAAVPGRSIGRLGAAGAGLALGLGALLLLREPAHRWTPDAFLEVGLPCLRRAFVWSVVPWLALLFTLRRGAP